MITFKGQSVRRFGSEPDAVAGHLGLSHCVSAEGMAQLATEDFVAIIAAGTPKSSTQLSDFEFGKSSGVYKLRRKDCVQQTYLPQHGVLRSRMLNCSADSTSDDMSEFCSHEVAGEKSCISD